MLKRVILENQQGQTIRFFACEGEMAHLICFKDNNRLALVSNIESLKDRPFEKVAFINYEELKARALNLIGLGQLRLVEEVQEVVGDVRRKSLEKTALVPSLFLIGFVIFGLMGSLLSDPEKNVKIEEQLKQHVIQIVKKKPTPPPPPKKVAPKPKKEMKVTKKSRPKRKAVKRLGALAVLGSGSKNSKRAGGVNLGAMKTSPGPGLGGGTGGSGGIQTSLYGKGLVAAPVGPGANIKGGGGYGTKGKGGGQAGYGQTTLVGSTGTATIPLGEESIVEGGLDPASIARVIQRNMGQVRFCYEQGLQRDPKIAGRVAVKFIIGGNGRVKSAGIKSSTLSSTVVEECILNRLKTWKFPQPRGGVDVNVGYPFLLRRMGSG